MIGGDFYFHMGRDAVHHGVDGSQGLCTPSSGKAYQMMDWMRTNALHIIDRRIPCQRRGTWYNCARGKWFENDVFLTENSFLQHQAMRWTRLHTFGLAG